MDYLREARDCIYCQGTGEVVVGQTFDPMRTMIGPINHSFDHKSECSHCHGTGVDLIDRILALEEYIKGLEHKGVGEECIIK